MPRKTRTERAFGVIPVYRNTSPIFKKVKQKTTFVSKGKRTGREGECWEHFCRNLLHREAVLNFLLDKIWEFQFNYREFILIDCNLIDVLVWFIYINKVHFCAEFNGAFFSATFNFFSKMWNFANFCCPFWIVRLQFWQWNVINISPSAV